MANDLQGKKIAILATDMFEQVELVEPRKALDQAGAETHLISLKPGKIQGFNHFDPADTFQVDKAVEEVDASEYDALMIPGGVGNPDQLRGDENAVSFVRDRKLTSWPTLQTDIRNAGGNWVDQQVVVDQGLVTSRKPDDIPAFNAKLIEEFAEGRHEAQAEKTEHAIHAEATPS